MFVLVSFDKFLLFQHSSTYMCLKYINCQFTQANSFTTIAGFCPHWSGVVGPNHHSAFFTTTRAQNGLFLPPLRENNSTKMQYSIQHNIQVSHHSDHSGQNPAIAILEKLAVQARAHFAHPLLHPIQLIINNKEHSVFKPSACLN